MKSSDIIKRFLLDNLSKHQKDIVQTAINQFGISRQAIHRHMNSLIKDNKVKAHGTTKGRHYELMPYVNYTKTVDLNIDFSIDILLKNQIRPLLKSLPKNILEIFEFATGALLNNVQEHSNAMKLYVKLFIKHDEAHFIVSDNGIGIFEHIKSGLRLPNVQLAAIELAKGNVTANPSEHSGDEMNAVIHLFDKVEIASSGQSLSFINNRNEWKIYHSTQTKGTRMHLLINPSSNRTCSEIFNNIFSSGQKKISIPLNLLETSNQSLINSKIKAKSVLRNIQNYDVVEFDFKKIKLIGPAFADTLVRETKEKNKYALIEWINTNKTVDLLMSRALNRKY
tara:strand:+ start:488 stop:1501 length:1014 start_codon:yes stop_codon:yes gene_type:complete